MYYVLYYDKFKLQSADSIELLQKCRFTRIYTIIHGFFLKIP